MSCTKWMALPVAAWALTAAGVLSAQQLPLEPVRERGQSISPAYEGWYQNADGTFTLLIGYYNRNRAQILDVPIGPNNRIEPGGPDQGQPTHFLSKRQWGVFSITVPKGFGNKRLTWTLVANGETNAIPVGLIPSYQIEPFKDAAMGNTPPVLKLQEGGPELIGPPRIIAALLATTVGQPVALTFWVSDDQHTAPGDKPRMGRPLSVFLSKFRGPGDVTFDDARPQADPKAGGKVTANATFSAPGDYIVRIQVNDSTGEGGGGFQCCWTNGHVKVTVAGGAK